MTDTINYRDIEIFSTLADDEIQTFIKILKKKKFKQNQVIFPEGARGREMFIVTKGVVGSRTILSNGMTRKIARFERGDFFGDMSIFEHAPRSATCYAVVDTELLRLNDLDFFKFSEKNPEIATKIMFRMLNIITERLREKNSFLADMVEWGDRASKRAITDELACIYNRRFLDDSLEKYFKKSENIGKPLSLVMIDIDDFNYFYEKYSSQDIIKLLEAIVLSIRNHISENDILARYGGDEFSIILPETDVAEAMEICSTICRAVMNIDVANILNCEDKNVTVSIGVASYPHHASDIESLRTLSDKALYKAKHHGKNIALSP